MITRTVPLEEVRGRTLEDVLDEVVEQEEVLTVRRPDGSAVMIQPSPCLEPLPRLKCIVPKDWKDAINAPGR
ncbi:MAG TPA: hypothetical protein VNE39_03775 [Planctomycetota bacterium]|nr:hypothetical protein [Planctomycetota bacterium]